MSGSVRPNRGSFPLPDFSRPGPDMSFNRIKEDKAGEAVAAKLLQ